MKSIILSTVLFAALASPASAVVIVNGVAGEDDGSSPFETTQAAVEYAIANADPVVEIQTNDPIGGIQIIPSRDYLTAPLTIRAGAGYSPTFTSSITLNSATPDQPLALENINVDIPAGVGNAAVYAAGDVRITSCSIMAVHQGGGIYPTAIKCDLPSPQSDGRLRVENCVLAGMNGVLAGHAIRDYELTSCSVVAITSDLSWNNSATVGNIMNWETTDSGVLTRLIDSNTTITVAVDQAGTTAVLTLSAIDEPRTLTLDRCSLHSNGSLLAWPYNSLEPFGATYYSPGNEHTIGPVVATNTLFDGCNPLVIGNTYLDATQTPNSTFTHCTFRTTYGVTGAVRLRGNEDSTHEFTNCLFDSPEGVYGIGIDSISTGNITVTGDGNVYYIKSGTEYGMLETLDFAPPFTPLPPFEASTHTYSAPSTAHPFATNTSGTIVLPFAKDLVAAKAVPVTPPVTVDMFYAPRPQPATAPNADVGAYEFDETETSQDAVVYDSSAPATQVPFEDAQSAVSYAIANSMDTVEIQTDTPIGGFAITPDVDYLRKPLTIKPAAGVDPAFTMALTINPANPGSTVTLENIDVDLPAGTGGACLYAAGNVALFDCAIEANHPGGGSYPVGIACNLRSPGQDGTLLLQSCTVTGHNAVVAGHSIKTYISQDSTIVGITSDLNWNLTGTFVNLMNWETAANGSLTNLIDDQISIPVADGSGGTTNVTLDSIQEPRTLIMNRTILRSNGSLLAWPPNTLEFNGNFYYGDVNDHTIGPVIATNCLFDGCNPVLIGNPFLYPTQDMASVFTHCTFRTTYGVTGAVRLRGNDAVTQTFTNCLFDSPDGLYGIGVEQAAVGVQVAGDGNVYCIEPGVEYNTIMTSSGLELQSRPPFEATSHTYAPPADPPSFLVGTDGRPLIPLAKTLAGGKAVDLSPGLAFDLYLTPRAQPATAAHADVGAVEFDETPSATVRDWVFY